MSEKKEAVEKKPVHIYFIENSWMCVIYQKNNGTFDRFIVEVFLAIEKAAHRMKKLSFFYMHNKHGERKKSSYKKLCYI